jgi:glucose-6-phosphate 1-dehydrogenase
VVFGATGDLMDGKIAPALYHLHERGRLPARFRVVGFARRELADDAFRETVRASVRGHHAHVPEETDLCSFLSAVSYVRGVFEEPEGFSRLADRLRAIDDEWGTCSNKLFFLAVPPGNYGSIIENLAGRGLTTPCSATPGEGGWTCVIVEKPFGRDGRSARGLDESLGTLFEERQIYRIDHYLAKEMLQGILNFRFTNNLFEHEWNRSAIESIDITLLEALDASKRGPFYDKVGALRDVGQNHLLQMLALVTMDRPASRDADDIRDARATLIESLRPLGPTQVAADTFRAQYSGFRVIAGVRPDSATETYFQLRTRMDGSRWAGVCVTMESGKSMGEACKRIVVTFRQPEAHLCPEDTACTNRIVFTLEPADQIEIVFFVKKPGFDEEIEERRFTFFLYEKAEKAQYVEEYAKLMHDAFLGDQTLFVSTREVDAGWRFIDPICDAWGQGFVPLEHYEAGTADIVRIADEALTHPGARRQVGVCGLGKMGAGLALNLVDSGWEVVGWNRHHDVAEKLAADGVVQAASIRELVAALRPPRTVWVMVPSGAPVDDVLFAEGAGLASFLSPGDTVIDGGNSHFSDAAPRAERLAEIGIHFLDCGTSGGPAGARSGACLMIGGDREVFEDNESMFADVALPDGHRFFPGHGAGHFVKMVHNGIEYGMMQAIAEGFEIMHASDFALDLEDVAEVYQHGSVVESRLVGWLQGAYAELGSDLEGVSGVVGHTGEGAWTVEAARELGLAAPAIADSLKFRMDSDTAPSYAGQVLTALRNAFGGHGLGPGGGPRR